MGGAYTDTTYAGIFYEHRNHIQTTVGSFTHQLFNKSILICYYNTWVNFYCDIHDYHSILANQTDELIACNWDYGKESGIYHFHITYVTATRSVGSVQ